MQRMKVEVGGRTAVALGMDPSGLGGKPGIVGAEILPGRGMNVYQLRAFIPGKGVVELLASPQIAKGAQQLTGRPEDPAANKTFAWAAHPGPLGQSDSRILSADQQTIEALIQARKFPLLANGGGKTPRTSAVPYMGCCWRARWRRSPRNGPRMPFVIGSLEAGDFNGAGHPGPG